MEGHAVISHDVLASYAADAARGIEGVSALRRGPRRRHGVSVAEDDGLLTVEIHLTLAWGASAPEVGAAVQRSVADYLKRMTMLRPASVDVVVGGIEPGVVN